MRVDVAFTYPELRAFDLADRVVVVIDVLRATTTMVTAFEHGCRAFIPTTTPEEARAEVARHAPGTAILAGERGGHRIDRFEAGNSPYDYPPEVVADKTVVLTTTNGTYALRAAAGGRLVLVGALRNAEAVARRVIRSGLDPLFACSGETERYSLEDSLCAGRMVARVRVLNPGPLDLRDGAVGALALFEWAADRVPAIVAGSEWGRKLVALGREIDVRFCSEVDVSGVVPVLRDTRVVLE